MSRCDSEGATHHTGCECHEARRDAEIERLRSALRLLWEDATDGDRCQFEYAPGCYSHHISKPCRDAVKAALNEGGQ